MDENITSQPAPDDVLDDVEGHGLREVAVGVSAAAVLGTGGMAIAGMTSTANVVGPGVQPVVSDTTHLTGHTASGASGIVGTTASDAGVLTRDSARTANDLTRPVVSRALIVANRELGIAGTEVKDAVRLADNAVAGSVELAGTTARSAIDIADHDVSVATATVKSTENTATNTVARTETSAVKTAGGAVVTVNKTTIKVINVARTIAGDWSMNVSILGATADAGGPSPVSTHPSGTVRLTDATGHLLASASIHNGVATLHFQGATAHQTLTLHYPGSVSFSPSTVHYTL